MKPVLLAALAACCVACSTVVLAVVLEGDASAVPGSSVDAGGEPRAPPWSFAVLSDLHLPNRRRSDVDRVVSAVIERGVRFVVITGDHTNGNEGDADSPRIAASWRSVTDALRPLRRAGIPVLPVAGNHDSYTSAQRAAYAATFRDLDAWAGPLTIHRPPNPNAGGLATPPFAYSVDVDGIHLVFAHIVTTGLEREVADWLRADLAGASGARRRLVFGHVPLVSVMATPSRRWFQELAPILERGGVDMYIAGHEHLVWDETFTLPGGGSLRQITVGCSSGTYNYGPTASARERARCRPIGAPGASDSLAGARGTLRCQMPNGGMFDLVRDRNDRTMIQHAAIAFAVVTVDSDRIDVTPWTLSDDGLAHPFYSSDQE